VFAALAYMCVFSLGCSCAQVQTCMKEGSTLQRRMHNTVTMLQAEVATNVECVLTWKPEC